MAVRSNFSPGFISRARTVGFSPDGARAFVIAKDKYNKVWMVEFDRASGKNLTQLSHVEHSAVQEASFFGAQREGIPHEFVRAYAGDVSGKGLPKLTRSHRSMRIALPGRVLGAEPINVLVGTKKNFEWNWNNVRRDPADGVPAPKRR